MADFIAGVASAVAQEVVSKAISFMLGKREERASQENNIERLEMAVSALEFAIERTAKLPITDASLLHRTKMMKRAYIEGTDLINKHQQHAVHEQEEIGQGVKRKRWTSSIRAKDLFMSSFAGLNGDDVRRFEWFADCSSKFIRDVESGCSLRHYTFCSPLVRHLLEGQSLVYIEQQGSRLRSIDMWPICSEGRGVETMLDYHYEDHKMPEKSFDLTLILRLSESTDIVGTTLKCLQSTGSQFKHLNPTAMGELTLLLSNLQGIPRSYDRLPVGIQDSYTRWTQSFRPDPVCCRENGHGPCADNFVSSCLSRMFPEHVIYFSYQGFIPEPEHSSHSSSSGGNLTKDRRPFLQVTAEFQPHSVDKKLERYGAEIIGGNKEHRDVSIQQVAETVRSNAANYFLHQPERTYCRIIWLSKHGDASFLVRKAKQ